MSEEVKVKISQPMFEVGELERFDNNIHSIVEEYSKLLFKEKDQILTQRIIMKQEEEIERLNNIINEITKMIKDDYFKAYNYTKKIEQSEKPQGDYPVYYYYNLKKKELTDEYLNRIKELKGVNK